MWIWAIVSGLCGGLAILARNTGLALVAAAGLHAVYRLGRSRLRVFKMSREKVLHLKALGARVIMTRSDVEKGHPDYYQDLARRLASDEGAFYVNQFENPANPLAHETTTGPELVRQFQGKLDAMVCGVGSGGTITGKAPAETVTWERMPGGVCSRTIFWNPSSRRRLSVSRARRASLSPP